jgi:hypothetical protein
LIFDKTNTGGTGGTHSKENVSFQKWGSATGMCDRFENEGVNLRFEGFCKKKALLVYILEKEGLNRFKMIFYSSLSSP